MTDCERIIEYMIFHKGITVAECRDNLGTTELRKRISEIRRKGFKIFDRWEEGYNRVGKKTHFKRYFYIGGPND